jgi:hypothetical protein
MGTPKHDYPDFFLPSALTPSTPAPAACGEDLLARGLAWLTGQFQAHASQPVVYRRGVDAVAVCATFGQKLLKLDDGEGGVRMEWTDMDFLIPAASLDFGDGPFLPERGDLIDIDAGATVETFEVAPYGFEAAWRWSDPHRTLVRIHAKHVGTEAYS